MEGTGVMDKDLVFEDFEIRDQADHTSDISFTGEFNAETIGVINTLDQQVDFQLQGCISGNWFDMKTFSQAATSRGFQTVTDYFECYRLIASCPANPTTGNLNVWVVKSK
jgi:hypothetical protein